MQAPKDILNIQTRGDFRALSERASQGSSNGSGSLIDCEVPSDHPMWDAWGDIKSTWPGPCANWEVQPPLAWIHAVDGLTREQIGNGVRNLIHFENEKGDKSFPPSAGQFRDLCLYDPDWAHKRLKYIEPLVAIEDQTAKAKRKSEGLYQMRALRERTGL